MEMSEEIGHRDGQELMRTESVDSIDRELDWLINKGEKKDIEGYNNQLIEDEDNISEEKLKQEHEQNEKGVVTLVRNPPNVVQDSEWPDESDHRVASSPHSDPGAAAPQPTDATSRVNHQHEAPSGVENQYLRVDAEAGSDGDVSELGPGPADVETSGMSGVEVVGAQAQREHAGWYGRAQGAHTTWYDDEDKDIDDFDLSDDMSDDQKKAMLELHHMRLDLAYTEDDPPEYDVAERVRQLNEELAKDPTPLEDDRERSIKFKDNLIDLVAPPPDYPSDEEESVMDSRLDRSPPAGGSSAGGSSAGGSSAGGSSAGGSSAGSSRAGGSRADGSRAGSSRVGSLGSGGDDQSNADMLNIDRMNIYDHEPNGAGDEADESRYGYPGEDVPQQEESGDKPSGQANSASSTSAQDKVLVERDGKFELLSAKDLTPEERELFLPPVSDDDDGPESVESARENAGSRETLESPLRATVEDNSSSSLSSDGSFHPTPPREPRPVTASVTQHRRQLVVPLQRRAQSANTSRLLTHSNYADFDYNSPYALSENEKELLRKQKKQHEDRKRKESELAKIENDQKKRENEGAFQAWLKNKRIERRRHDSTDTAGEETKKKEKAEKDKEAEAAFKTWLKSKHAQKRRERGTEEVQKKEVDEGWYERPREDCDKAFRQWLKKKNHDARKAKKQEGSRARIHRLLVRRTRKAMQLARALKQSQNVRYVDYYGYRY